MIQKFITVKIPKLNHFGRLCLNVNQTTVGFVLFVLVFKLKRHKRKCLETRKRATLGALTHYTLLLVDYERYALNM